MFKGNKKSRKGAVDEERLVNHQAKLNDVKTLMSRTDILDQRPASSIVAQDCVQNNLLERVVYEMLKMLKPSASRKLIFALCMLAKLQPAQAYVDELLGCCLCKFLEAMWGLVLRNKATAIFIPVVLAFTIALLSSLAVLLMLIAPFYLLIDKCQEKRAEININRCGGRSGCNEVGKCCSRIRERRQQRSEENQTNCGSALAKLCRAVRVGCGVAIDALAIMMINKISDDDAIEVVPEFFYGLVGTGGTYFLACLGEDFLWREDSQYNAARAQCLLKITIFCTFIAGAILSVVYGAWVAEGKPNNLGHGNTSRSSGGLDIGVEAVNIMEILVLCCMGGMFAQATGRLLIEKCKDRCRKQTPAENSYPVALLAGGVNNYGVTGEVPSAPFAETLEEVKIGFNQ